MIITDELIEAVAKAMLDHETRHERAGSWEALQAARAYHTNRTRELASVAVRQVLAYQTQRARVIEARGAP